MAERSVGRRIRLRYRGRSAQVSIYLGKMLRMFVYQNDWKVLPMAALIAGLVGMVIRNRLFVSMEGTLMGALAMACVGIWNGSFNSIQVICRERDIVKREHRSGMHVSSYVFSHMLYQAMLCLLQTGVTMYVTHLTGVKYFDEAGLFTPWRIADMGISVFLITYASDMLSLFVSALSRSTTAAMTVMPFVMIFQLVFSGGMLNLPAWSRPLSRFTISSYGLKVLCAQADYNGRDLVTAWNTLEKMTDQEIGGRITLGQALDFLTDGKNPAAAEIRARQIGRSFTLGELRAALEGSESIKALKEKQIGGVFTLGGALRAVLEREELSDIRALRLGGYTAGELIRLVLNVPGSEAVLNTPISRSTTVGGILESVGAEKLLKSCDGVRVDAVTTVGEVADALAANPDVARLRDRAFEFRTTLGKILEAAGKDRVRTFILRKAAEASRVQDYEYTAENIADYWGTLILFALAFALLSTAALEFIDKDKR